VGSISITGALVLANVFSFFALPQIAASWPDIQSNPLYILGGLFSHEDLGHLMGNMLFLCLFGNAVEAGIGRVKFLLVYFMAGVLSFAGYAFIDPMSYSLGASGAISGIAACYPSVQRGWFKKFYGTLVVLGWFWLQLLAQANAFSSSVAYLAHIMGAFIGLTSLNLFDKIFYNAD
jgi:membrane associated rhomboid family serine protease